MVEFAVSRGISDNLDLKLPPPYKFGKWDRIVPEIHERMSGWKHNYWTEIPTYIENDKTIGDKDDNI